MTRKILVPIDLSTEHPPELAFAAGLAKNGPTQILLLHVIDYVPTLLPVELPGGYPLPQTDLVKDAAKTKLDRVARHVDAPDIRPMVEIGGAATAIVDVARREKVDQIVMGSHRHGAMTRMVLGSVADRVAHTAECPVTIVRERP
jgi:nucleotide-binding universal stress UspA family protein